MIFLNEAGTGMSHDHVTPKDGYDIMLDLFKGGRLNLRVWNLN